MKKVLHIVNFCFNILPGLLLIFLSSCGQQRVTRYDKGGDPNLVIEAITYQRASSVSHDPYGRPLIANAKIFDFLVTISNIGEKDFVGKLSISNTRSDLNKYEYTQSISDEIVRIPSGGSMHVTISEMFPYSVRWVRFKLKGVPINDTDEFSSLEDNTIEDVKEIKIPDR